MRPAKHKRLNSLFEASHRLSAKASLLSAFVYVSQYRTPRELSHHHAEARLSHLEASNFIRENQLHGVDLMLEKGFLRAKDYHEAQAEYHHRMEEQCDKAPGYANPSDIEEL